MGKKGASKIIYGKETILDLTADTVTASDLPRGVTSHSSNEERIYLKFSYPTDNMRWYDQEDIIYNPELTTGQYYLDHTILHNQNVVDMTEVV